MPSSVHPAFVLILGAVLVPFLRGRLRSAYLLLLPVAAWLCMLGLPAQASWGWEAFGHDLTLLRADRLSLVFGHIFHLAALLGLLFALHVKDPTQHVAALVYAGSAIGAVFAGDLLTLFLFWEVVGIAPVFLILARRTRRSYGAALRYLMVQIASGLLLLVGLAMRLPRHGLAFESMTDALAAGEPSALLIFLAFGLKCGWPVLHGWITDTYPEATPTGTVFLSAFTTKLAVYALARGYPGTEILVYVGAAMAMFPIFFAVIENDLRRVLCYSMINQIGYMVCGVGLGSALALNGTAAHAFCHILYKALLFMSMGAVLYRTGRIHGTDLGGLHHTMPWTATFCVVGAASISAFPLFSGFVSKSMILVAAADQGRTLVFFALLFAAAGVFHHAGIKIPYFSFFAHDSGLRPKEAPRNMLWAMGITAAFCVGLGVWPRPLYDLLPHSVDYVPYTTMHVVTQLQLLVFSALAFTTLVLTGLYPPELRSVNLDADALYRRGGQAFARLVRGPLMALFARLSALVHERVPRGLDYFTRNPAGAMRLAFERARLGWTGLTGSPQALDRAQARFEGQWRRYEVTRPGADWPVGRVVLYVTLALLLFLVAYLLR